MDYDKPIMENLHYHAFNYRNAHSTQASKDFNTLEEFVSNLGIAAGEKWREEWSEVCNENQDLHNEIDTLRAQNTALLEALELAMDNLRPHGDNCFLHDEGEYNSCFCGKDSLVNYLQGVVEQSFLLAEGKDV